MNLTEQPIVFDCRGERLFGVLALPEAPLGTAVLIVVGGPQYRVGSHRQFVLLARSLAAAGHAVLRFDYRGMGDSSGAPRDFESVADDIACALDALQRAVPQTGYIALWGLCDGASAALLYVHQRRDGRIGGLCLLNPWVRSEVGLARAHVKHYYGRRLLQREFWLKLASGQVGKEALRGFGRNLGRMLRARAAQHRVEQQADAPSATYQQLMANACSKFDGPILVILSGEDLVAKEFLDSVDTNATWRDAMARPGVDRHDIPGADHTFSSQAARKEVEQCTLSWLQRTVTASTTANE